MGPDDGQIQAFGQFGRATGMVDMGMGEPDLHQLHIKPLSLGQQVVQIAPWIDDGGLPGFIAPDDGGILLEGGDRDGVVTQWYT